MAAGAEEVREINQYFFEDKFDDYWWTRSGSPGGGQNVYVCSFDGESFSGMGIYSVNKWLGIRPAIWVSLS